MFILKCVFQHPQQYITKHQPMLQQQERGQKPQKLQIKKVKQPLL